jgi:hypothetical protein
VPFRVIPERGQVTEDGFEPAIAELVDILHEEVARSKLADQPAKLEPEPATRATEPGFIARTANVLARETAAYDVGGDSVESQSSCIKAPNICVARYLRPVSSQDGAAIAVDLAKRRRPKAGALEAETEPAYAAEEVLFKSFPPSESRRARGRD